jgi:hypothetical protein
MAQSKHVVPAINMPFGFGGDGDDEKIIVSRPLRIGGGLR